MATDLSGYTYTRRIYIDSVDFSSLVDQCSCSWGECGGPQQATLRIASADFDEAYGIQQGADVDIRYGDAAATRMWRGIVNEIATSLTEGLTIVAVGPKLRLWESVPTGVFGTLADTGPPLLLSATTSNAETGVDGIQTTLSIFILARSIDALGTTDYTDTTLDPASPIGGPFIGTTWALFIDAGVIAAGKQLDLSWTCGQNATGTEIGIIFDIFGPDQRTEFYDAVGDTLSVDGVFSPTEGTAFAASNTARQATIAGTTIESIVNHLLDTYLPSDMTKGTVEIGSLDVNVDLFDLTGSASDLNQVLTALRDLAGDVQWYVDAANAVHFIALGTTTAATFQIQGTPGTLATSDHDVLVGLTKKQTRDGITVVKIEGEDAMEDSNLENDDADWDETTDPTSPDETFAAITRDGRVHSIGISVDNATTIPEGATKANFIDANYPTLQSWLDDFPNQRWLYLKKESISAATIAQILDRLRTKVTAPPDAFSPDAASPGPVGNRPRMTVVPAPGVSTILSAGIVANNFLLRHNPNPVQWGCTLEKVETLYIPGQDRITVINTRGITYDLPIVAVSYQLDETVSASVTLGDTVITQLEEQTMQERSFAKMSLQKQHKARWQT